MVVNNCLGIEIPGRSALYVMQTKKEGTAEFDHNGGSVRWLTLFLLLIKEKWEEIDRDGASLTRKWRERREGQIRRPNNHLLTSLLRRSDGARQSSTERLPPTHRTQRNR